MAQIVETQGKLTWVVSRGRHGYTAWNDQLRLTAEAGTFADLKSVVDEILDDWFKARAREGSLQGIFQSMGWDPVPEISDLEEARFQVGVTYETVPEAH